LFAAVQLVFHVLLLVVLLSLRHLFVLDSDGSALQRINASNVLSTIRLSSLPTLLYLITASRTVSLLPVLLPYVVIVFLTDLADGRIARRRGQITRIGRYLDAFSDYSVLALTLFAFFWFGLIPRWFLWLVVIRLGVMSTGNLAIHLVQGYVEPRTSFLGKASIFSIMTLFAAKVLQLVPIVSPRFGVWVTDAVEKLTLMVAGVLVVSTIEKIYLLRSEMRKAVALRREQAEETRGTAD
jgi:phosphatidylglycerophosphate synthase